MKAFLYAGQGSQHAGMGRDLYAQYPAFRKIYDEAKLDFDLKTLSFEDPEGKINETRYTQPAMVAFACGVTAILKEMGIRPDFAAGLSLGEYSALACAEAISPETAIEMVAFRGKEMAKASAGVDCAMSAILGLSEEKLQEACAQAAAVGPVSICNYNCPGQLVIGGAREAVEEAAGLAQAFGAKRAIPLKVSGPFHTAYMKPAGDALAAYFEKIQFAEPKCRVLYNVLGSGLPDGTPEAAEIPGLLVQQVQKPVRMEAIIRQLLAAGVTEFIEIGPGKTLSGFVRKTAKDMGISDFRLMALETAEDFRQLAE